MMIAPHFFLDYELLTLCKASKKCESLYFYLGYNPLSSNPVLYPRIYRIKIAYLGYSPLPINPVLYPRIYRIKTAYLEYSPLPSNPVLYPRIYRI